MLDYLTHEELKLSKVILPCPFCGSIPRINAREIIHQEGSGDSKRLTTERVLYVSCCGGGMYRFFTWQTRTGK